MKTSILSAGLAALALSTSGFAVEVKNCETTCGRIEPGAGIARTCRAGGVRELLDSYVTAGRIAGVVSVLSDADYNEQSDCAGWDDYKKRKMTPDALFAIFSMTKPFTGAAM